MHEDESSMVTNTKLNNVGTAETSDSGNSSFALRDRKRCRVQENINTSLVRFKGVVPQQNGNWGAQIYANHQRIWLGTFKSEKEAAMAYDSAGVKLRNGDSHRNFPWTHDHLSIHEPNFQSLYTTEDVLNMIKDGSYQSKFADFMTLLSEKDPTSTRNKITINRNLVYGDVEFNCMQLFGKELTPSDVGKLNRLVIPKKYAAKYFPYEENDVQDIELMFYDKLMKTWSFRYCYWRSSQSFVFTRGWSRFVKEKNLREGDIITFYNCESPQSASSGGILGKCSRNFFLIDVNYIGEQSCSKEDKVLESSEQIYRNLPVKSELNLGTNLCCNLQHVNSEINEEKALNGLMPSHNVEEKNIILFGVRIN